MTTPAAGGESQNPSGGSGAAGAGEAAAGGAATGQEHLQFFPEELRGEKTLHKFTGKDKDEVFGKLAKSYVHLEKFQIPGDDAKPEDVAAFNRRRGIPEKVEEYRAALKPEIPEGAPWTPEVEAMFAEFAHKEGLTAKQATNAINFWAKLAAQGVDVQTSQKGEDLRKQHENLKGKWGANYERTVGLVHRTVEEYSNPEFNELLDSKFTIGGQEWTLGNHPAMLEFIARHGEGRLEAGFIQGNTLLQTQASAQAELSKIFDDKTHPYWKGDKAALKKVQELLAIAEPPKAPR